MPTVYKLTTQALTTYGGFQWELGVARETSGEGRLCGPGWLHYYHDPLLAVLLNLIHADFDDPVLWRAEAEGKRKDDHGLKGGCTRLTLVERMPLPVVTTDQRVRFAILCAREVCDIPSWRKWADGWLSGEDRSESAAAEAWSPDYRGLSAKKAAAARAAAAAARAAEYVARAAEVRQAVRKEVWSASAAVVAAEAAEYAAWAAKVDLAAIAREAVRAA